MTLGADLSRRFHAVSLDSLAGEELDHARTLLVDALACMLGGATTEVAGIGRATAEDGGARRATILLAGPKVSMRSAVLANGTMLRALDFMDVYVDADVSHPSESIPVALAVAEACGASGRDFLETVVAALATHVRLAGALPLHKNRLHHVGHAAWVAPLVAGRLMGLGEAGAANALNLSVAGMFVPEGFSRGHLANVKALAFPLIARQALDLAELGEAGLRAQPGACEEVLRLLSAIIGHDIDPAALVPDEATSIRGITLKAYPAQYALQPLVAAAAAFAVAHPERVRDIAGVTVRVARQTVDRTADPAKFRPASREAADHSLPFCVAAGLLDGALTPATLERERWRDADLLAMTGRMQVEVVSESQSFAIGRQEIALAFADGTTTTLDCAFPPPDTSWREIALGKLEALAPPGTDAAGIADIVGGIENEPDVSSLVAALGGRRARPATGTGGAS